MKFNNRCIAALLTYRRFFSSPVNFTALLLAKAGILCCFDILLDRPDSLAKPLGKNRHCSITHSPLSMSMNRVACHVPSVPEHLSRHVPSHPSVRHLSPGARGLISALSVPFSRDVSSRRPLDSLSTLRALVWRLLILCRVFFRWDAVLYGRSLLL